LGLKTNFTDAQVAKELALRFQRIENAILAALKRLGEECVRVARIEGNYIDQTGNLRSSIGYVLVVNGKIVESNFQSATKDLDGKGVSTGQKFAEEKAKEYSKGYALIVVAGMNYAAAVESRSRDVLTSAEIYAKQRLPAMLQSLKLNIK
jgi:hypothetical protein